MIGRTVLAVLVCLSAAVAADVSTPPTNLGVSFVEGSTSTLILERDGKRYLVDVAAHSIREASARNDPNGKTVFQHNCTVCHGEDGKGKAAVKTPDFTDPKVQATLTDAQIVATIRDGKKGTTMPSWKDKLSDAEISAVAGYVRSLGSSASQFQAPATAEIRRADVYQPGDDLLISLPTGRSMARHGMDVDFTHRFAFDPAFSGQARGASLFGLDGVAISSFGFRYGITNALSASVYRSPGLIARPIQLMLAYDLVSESKGAPVNAAFRFSVDGEDNFSRNFTENLEGVFSRSITDRAQVYFVPTLSFNNRRLFVPSSFVSSAIPGLPGFTTFSTGFGLSVDVRPTVALVAEAIPTFVNGRPLDIHHPAYAFGIQKKIWRHAFTFGFSNSPGTTVSQRAGTRSSYLGDPSADGPSKMFISFDLMRQLH